MRCSFFRNRRSGYSCGEVFRIAEEYLQAVDAWEHRERNMSFIRTENLVHEYIRRDENGDEVAREQALRGVSLEIPSGSFVAVLGANGSGKSTFAKHLNALLTPTSGTVTVNGLNTAEEKNLWEVRKMAGMAFQNPDNQIVATVVEEDVAFGPENLGVPQNELVTRVEQALKKVGMFEYRYHSPNRLSGGQKQRVAVAGVLAMKSACIIMDEPTAMLDPNGRKEVIETVHQLNREEGITVILITHYMDEVTDADYVYVMQDGNVALQGNPREVFSRVQELLSMKLTVPCATELGYRLKKAGLLKNSGSILTNEDLVREMQAFPISESAGTNPLNEADSEPAPQAPVLSLEHVSYTYSAGTAYEKKALKDVSLSVYPGEFVGLIGHTGSGKSTLIQHFNGLEKPGEGVIRFHGEDISGETVSGKMLRSKVGLVFQYPEYQLFESTVLKDVCFGPLNLGLTKEEAETRAKEALALVHFPENMIEDNPLELSGGQKRRAAIAGVLAMKPEVLVLDEPTAGLDPVGHIEILTMLDRIHRETGMAIVLVSHSMEDVAEYADRVIVMSDGEKVLEGNPKEVFRQREKMESLGLAAPQISYLMEDLKKAGLTRNADVITMDEAEAVLLSERRHV